MSLVAFVRDRAMKQWRAWHPAGLILLYHRVATLTADPWALALTPARFEEQLQVLRSVATPLPLATLLRLAHEKRLPPRAVALTFDDGYYDSLDTIKPLLARYGIPATFYITAGFLDGHAEFWWDRLEQIVFSIPDVGRLVRLVRPGDGETRGDEGHDRTTVCRELWNYLYALSPNERDATLKKWAGEVGVTLGVRTTHRCLTPQELCRLAEGELTTIGAHTVSHPPLATLDAFNQSREIGEGKTRLEEILGSEVRSFGYPIGRSSDYTNETVRLVREHGFQFACTTRARPVTSRSDDFLLPRIRLHDLEAEQFEQALSWWFTKAS